MPQLPETSMNGVRSRKSAEETLAVPQTLLVSGFDTAHVVTNNGRDDGGTMAIPCYRHENLVDNAIEPLPDKGRSRGRLVVMPYARRRKAGMKLCERVRSHHLRTRPTRKLTTRPSCLSIAEDTFHTSCGIVQSFALADLQNFPRGS
jgi:hypothetical protein